MVVMIFEVCTACQGYFRGAKVVIYPQHDKENIKLGSKRRSKSTQR
jgi:hypothetical protein